MVTALYRRYRPENFAELIGQTQVTDPLRTALRTNRVNHAYLFSGPRGCGKTTSARILARCLNCAQGPTDTPCGVCASCVELSRDGGGSLDVIEIDAASHNGVDDARDIRDRAVFAPARDRFKIFILDEAHMVTPQGFNALLKVVEEPPEHVKFIFATTEPDKVIGTIRSRTHHYPFRLVPPAQMLEYVHELCESESVEAAPGVLPLVVRAGGGSVRDTLSLLDQLMAGSENGAIEYERAVALLGYTHASLLDDVVEALGARDGAAAFAAVDRVVQTGQDPRRFVEDLLERLRDLIVVGATVEGASAVLRGVTADELDRLVHQSHAFGAAELSRSADVVNRALTDMTGATSPRLHLELMIARVLVPESDQTGRGALARVERLERRVGVEGPGSASSAAPGPSTDSRPTEVRPASGRSAPAVASSAPASTAPAATSPSAAPVEATPSTEAAGGPSAVESATASWATAAPSAPADPVGSSAPATTEPAPPSAPHSAAWAQTPDPARGAGSGAAPVTLQQLRDSWPEIVEVVQKARRTAWMVVVTATVVDFADDVLTLAFPSANDVESFKRPQGAAEGVSEYLRRAIVDVLGVKVKYIARVEGDGPAGPTPTGAPPVDASVPPAASGPQRDTGRSAAPATDGGQQASAPSPQGSTSAETGRTTAAAAEKAAPEASAVPAANSPRTSAPAAAPATAERRGAPATASPTAERSSAPAPVTGWDVATIPQTPPPEPDEPEHITEEPPGGVPTVDAAPPPPEADVPPAGRSVSGPPSSAATASTPGPASPAATAGAGPSVAERRAATGDPRRGIPTGSRYGEAVVREILGAQFIEEETIAPRVTPQRSE
ncbi:MULTISPECIES: DNA polymerase III subunit gamma and tau [unclassified Frigoribacterium]|uniref:DNA polymerase III subunit gamma and tau n=1 Tax=unclassified Frigoribacterium TaxID=2627005 RepID=UPI0006F97562|nr:MULTISPECIES: DNA polymerase III subunit gamma and tau [unclassified Frigoribacterium]KQO46531.1 DNA polymerase III subunit gamma/tau [Frigoribacterium sp. Leaf254]KQT38624.1 DNA polymerase III subunit gamma/tau [Frigoribacterium sp. Leaf415]